jgi:hypothetical protein
VNLNAFWSRFVRAESSLSRSPLMARALSMGMTAKSHPRELASREAASLASATKDESANNSCLCGSPAAALTSTKERVTSAERATRLRLRSAPVDPAIESLPDSRAVKAMVAVCSEFRSSWARKPSF